MDTSLIKTIDQTELMALAAISKNNIAIFPQFGFENTPVHIYADPDIKEIRIVKDSVTTQKESTWIPCVANSGIRIDHDALKSPGRYILQVEWRGSHGESGCKTLSYEIKPALLLGEGAVVGLAISQRIIGIARQTGVELLNRTTKELIGHVFLPSIHPIKTISINQSSDWLSIGTLDGWVFVFSLQTGQMRYKIRLGDHDQPITYLVALQGGFFAIIGKIKWCVCAWNLENEVKIVSQQICNGMIHGIMSPDNILNYVNLDLKEIAMPFIMSDDSNYMYTFLATSCVIVTKDVKLIGTVEFPKEFGFWKGISRTAENNKMFGVTENYYVEFCFTNMKNEYKIIAKTPLRKSCDIQKIRMITQNEFISCSKDGLNLYSIHKNPTDSPLFDGNAKLLYPGGLHGDIISSNWSELHGVIVVGDEYGKVTLINPITGIGESHRVHQGNSTYSYSDDATDLRITQNAHVNIVYCIPNQPLLVTGGFDMNLKLHKMIDTHIHLLWADKLNGNAQDISWRSTDSVFAVSTPLDVKIGIFNNEAITWIGEWQNPLEHGSDYLDPIAIHPNKAKIIVGDWMGNLHFLEQGNHDLQWKCKKKLNVCKESLLQISFIDEKHLIAVSELKNLFLIDIENVTVLGVMPCHQLDMKSRRSQDLIASDGNQSRLIINPLGKESLSSAYPLYGFSTTALCWHNGCIYLDDYDLFEATEFQG